MPSGLSPQDRALIARLLHLLQPSQHEAPGRVVISPQPRPLQGLPLPPRRAALHVVRISRVAGWLMPWVAVTQTALT